MRAPARRIKWAERASPALAFVGVLCIAYGSSRSRQGVTGAARGLRRGEAAKYN